MPTPRRLATLFLLLPALLALGLPPTASAAPAADRSPGTGDRGRGDYVETASAFYSGDGVIELGQDTRTSRRVRVLSHDYAIDARGDDRPDYLVYYTRNEDRPVIVTPDFERVRCARSTGRSLRGGRSEVTVPSRCLERRGAAPRAITVRPSVLVKLKRRSGDTCDTGTAGRLGPLRPGEGESTAFGRPGAAPGATRKGC